MLGQIYCSLKENIWPRRYIYCRLYNNAFIIEIVVFRYWDGKNLVGSGRGLFEVLVETLALRLAE